MNRLKVMHADISEDLGSQCLFVHNFSLPLFAPIFIRGVTGGTDQTSGGCSLCYTIPI